jgi:hypothetical protein
VKERLLEEYAALPGLAAELVAACEAFHAFKRAKGL